MTRLGNLWVGSGAVKRFRPAEGNGIAFCRWCQKTSAWSRSPWHLEPLVETTPRILRQDAEGEILGVGALDERRQRYIGHNRNHMCAALQGHPRLLKEHFHFCANDRNTMRGSKIHDTEVSDSADAGAIKRVRLNCYRS